MEYFKFTEFPADPEDHLLSLFLPPSFYIFSNKINIWVTMYSESMDVTP